MDIEPAQCDVAREAGLCALSAGDPERAVILCEKAVKNKSNDAGLKSNLALAYMLAGEDERAMTLATDALALAPGDDICKNVFNYIRDVQSGRCERPIKINP